APARLPGGVRGWTARGATRSPRLGAREGGKREWEMASPCPVSGFIRRGVAKRPKAPGFDPGIRRFESCRPCHSTHRNGQSAAEHDTKNEAGNLLLSSGTANRPLALAVCRELGVRPGNALASTFSDGAAQVEVEEHVRRQDVFVG